MIYLLNRILLPTCSYKHNLTSHIFRKPPPNPTTSGSETCRFKTWKSTRCTSSSPEFDFISLEVGLALHHFDETLRSEESDVTKPNYEPKCQNKSALSRWCRFPVLTAWRRSVLVNAWCVRLVPSDMKRHAGAELLTGSAPPDGRKHPPTSEAQTAANTF